MPRTPGCVGCNTRDPQSHRTPDLKTGSNSCRGLFVCGHRERFTSTEASPPLRRTLGSREGEGRGSEGRKERREGGKEGGRAKTRRYLPVIRRAWHLYNCNGRGCRFRNVDATVQPPGKHGCSAACNLLTGDDRCTMATLSSVNPFLSLSV